MSDVKPVAWMDSDCYEWFLNGDAYAALATRLRAGCTDAPLYSKESIDALQAEIEALRKDAERLDVLLKAITPSGQLVCGCYDPRDGACDWIFIDGNGTPLTGYYDTPREAIDALAAIAKEKQP